MEEAGEAAGIEGKEARVCLAARVGVGGVEGRIGCKARGVDWPKPCARGDNEPSQRACNASPFVIGQRKTTAR